ncbi:MAG TPA: YbaB/EbfC family nucleoid-associated protein [Anaerolineales bacterium]|nr:YbaB/EbfC family nucleoid-associated protein [Anaerolineales bacterium]
MNPNKLLQQLGSIQEQMRKAQAQLAQETIELTSAGGAVKVVINGAQRLQSVEINPELLQTGDTELINDALVAAINDAIERSQTLAAEKLGNLTGGLGLPGF